MARSFSGMRWKLPKLGAAPLRDPRSLVRIALGLLLAANIVAALFVFRPWGGSAEDLARRVAALRQQIAQRQAGLVRTRAIVAKVDKGRGEGDRFLSDYFLSRRNAYSTIVAEIGKSAQGAGIKPKEHTFAFEPVEGSDTLSMMTITGNYEGNYGDLVQFLNALDRSPRLLIVESLQAAPQQAAGMLNVNVKLNTFVREDGQAR